VGILLSHLSTGAFAESDTASAAFALTGKGAGYTLTSPYASLGVSRDFATPSGLVITPDAELGYRYDNNPRGEQFNLTAADGTTFDGARVNLDRSTTLVGLSLTLHEGQWTAFAKYRGQIAGDWSSQGGALGVRLAF